MRVSGEQGRDRGLATATPTTAATTDAANSGSSASNRTTFLRRLPAWNPVNPDVYTTDAYAERMKTR